METRRAALIKGIQIAGVAMTAPLLSAATPFVRLPDEQGDLSDERGRFRAELNHLAEFGPLRPASLVMPLILSTWSNINATYYATNDEVAGYKARAAILAGDRSITINDPTNGYRWFSLAQRYSRMCGDPELISLAHAREGLARLYWDEKSKYIAIDAKLAHNHAVNDQQRGMAFMVFARFLANMGDQNRAERMAEQAVEMAVDAPGASPRPDRWLRPMAHSMAARVMSRFPDLLPSVEAHSHAAMAGMHLEATQNRTHAMLNVGTVRVRAREYEGAEQVIRGILSSLPPGALQPVLAKQVRGIADLAISQDPASMTAREIRDLADSVQA